MYLKPVRTYYDSDGTQHVSRGPFLILVQSENAPCGPDNFRAIVRKVALRQLGHFMMGTARIHGKSFTMSGSYGGDGLPKTVPEDVFRLGIPVPQKLYDAWNKGGGWNSAGSEASAMREWAIKTFGIK